MSILDWLSGKSGADEPPPDRRMVLRGPGSFSVPIVGESHYQEAIKELAGGYSEEGAQLSVEAQLLLEDANRYDAMAVRVEIEGQTVGYLSRDSARQYRAALAKTPYPRANAYCSAQIRGGWDRGRGDRGHFGVFLDLYQAGEQP